MLLKADTIRHRHLSCVMNCSSSSNNNCFATLLCMYIVASASEPSAASLISTGNRRPLPCCLPRLRRISACCSVFDIFFQICVCLDFLYAAITACLEQLQGLHEKVLPRLIMSFTMNRSPQCAHLEVVSQQNVEKTGHDRTQRQLLWLRLKKLKI